ncbi:VOC family protein [Actinoplanes sp. NPDC051475]|uniref:VOC family protein n=1 Tax=Actinoplanes sp. NPDC051475 TaxID=3157225 RepID=UPI00344BD164
MTRPTPGVPNWVDLGTADLEDATRFYTRLFGWEADVSGEEYGGYTTFRLDGRAAAGGGPLYGEGQPTAWSTYIATDDADAVAARVEAAGGKVLVAPFDVMYQGRMAAFLDQAGAPFSVWQPGTMKGADVFDVPGSLAWNELVTRDVEGTAAFYGAVFGWVAREIEVQGLPYIVWELAGETVAGMQVMDATWPHDLSPHWMIYFAVADCDESAAYAQSLGARVARPPSELAIGRYVVLEDPQGGLFALLQAVSA